MATQDKTVTRVCPQCGRVLEETWMSCPYCGRNLNVTQEIREFRPKAWYGKLSIILGVVSLIVAGIPLGIAAIICGGIGLANDDNSGIIGIVLGIIGVILALAFLQVFL